MLTLGEGLAAYRICAKAEGRSERTVGAVTDAVRYFSRFLGEDDVDLQSLDGQSLRRFILALQSKQAFSNHRFTRTQNRKLSPEAIASYVRSIKSFFSFLAREELISNNPMAKVKSPNVPQKVIPTFTEAELRALLAQPDQKTNEGYRDYVMMATMLDTALRVSEMCGLAVSDVDLDNGYLRVMGKGAKERYVPIGHRLMKLLLKYKLHHRSHACTDKFFVTRDGRPINKKRVETIVRKYVNRAGIKTRCSPHTFRSTSAVLYLGNDGDTFSLQKKLGHSSLTMTRRYSELADADVRRKHLIASPLDRLFQ